MATPYKRVLIKISGEALLGPKEGTSTDHAFLDTLASELQQLQKAKCQIALVLGGGNIFRGAQDGGGHDLARDHYIGMTATIISSLIVEQALRKKGAKAVTLSALHIPQIGDAYSIERARKLLEEGNIVLCAGGTGNPFCTTDFAGALRAIELGCEVLIKATKVNGVYEKDPKKYPKAKKYLTLSYEEAMRKKLGVMDHIAFSLAEEHALPIIVTSVFEKKSLTTCIKTRKGGTLVSHQESTIL